MNIGSIKQNDAGIFIGRVSTLTVVMTIALREVRSANPKAPKYEIHAVNPGSREWVQVGALFELTASTTGEAFLNGRIDDPSLAQPLYISAFRQQDGSYNLVWQRPQRRRDVAAALAPTRYLLTSVMAIGAAVPLLVARAAFARATAPASPLPLSPIDPVFRRFVPQLAQFTTAGPPLNRASLAAAGRRGRTRAWPI